jgi:hypothetical protein
VGFEPVIPVFERVKTFYALHKGATVIDTFELVETYIIRIIPWHMGLDYLLCVIYIHNQSYIVT